VHQWLIEAGHEVFLDRDVRDGVALGERWRQRLWERLRWADAVVCVVTSAYLASTWCTAEVVATQSRGGRLLPLRVESDVAHPLLSSEVQYTTYVARDPVAARAAVAEALRRIDAAGGAGWSDDRCPFPGLRPFDIDWHRVFFGRTEETKQLVELLRSAAGGAALLVVGPSGCGKSSLVRAGLLPVMAGEPGWRTLAPILPGADPVRALARELAAAARRISLDWTVEHVHQRLTDSGLTGLADELLLADPSGPQQRLLVVVDQFEELLTQSAPGQRDRFAELLRPALSAPVHVVGTVRPEFLDQLLSEPGLSSLSTTIYPLRPLRREALRAVIEKPTQLAGIDLDEGLLDRLVDDTDSGDALPLLAFTLAQLADGVTRGGVLSSARYDQLGGVQGALTRHADAALAKAVNDGGRSREEVVAGLLRLVTVDEQGRPTRWRIPSADLPTSVVTELDAFVTRRLLTTDTHNDIVVIGVAHEAFLSAWPPLAQAIAENTSALRARRAVEQAATQWHDNGHPHQRLWGGGQLAAAVTDTGARLSVGSASSSQRHSLSRWLPRQRRVLVTDRVDISPTARDFLHTSIRRDRFRRRRALTVLSLLLCGALLAAGIAVSEQHTAQQQLRAATAGQLITQANSLTGFDPLTALKLNLAAHHLDPSGETHASLVTNLTTTRYSGTLTDHTGVSSVAFAPDGHTLATASDDRTVRLWDLSDRARPSPLGPPLTGHTGPVSSVAFAADGHTLATASEDRTVRLWDLTGLNDLFDHAVERACSFTRSGLDPAEWTRYIPGLPYQNTCPN
jgi:energy-coupling factor transporter ATP-binding protein EcfA2